MPLLISIILVLVLVLVISIPGSAPRSVYELIVIRFALNAGFPGRFSCSASAFLFSEFGIRFHIRVQMLIRSQPVIVPQALLLYLALAAMDTLGLLATPDRRRRLMRRFHPGQ